jgi:hypothetical protein
MRSLLLLAGAVGAAVAAIASAGCEDDHWTIVFPAQTVEMEHGA